MGTSIPKELMHNPEAYVNKDMEEKYANLFSDIPGFLKANKQNFIIRKKDIVKIFNNPQKKWGMGYYPQSGRIIIQTIKTDYNKSPERELILIGDQNPDEILSKFSK